MPAPDTSPALLPGAPTPSSSSIIPDLLGALSDPKKYIADNPDSAMAVIAGAPATVIALMALAVLIALFVYWLIHRGKINERNAKIGERDKEIAGLKGEIRILERQKADLESKVRDIGEQIKSPAQQWLVDLAELDRTTIDSVIEVQACKASWNLGAEAPFVSFKFTVFNGSVWTIILDKVEGHILYRKKQLKGNITISSEWRPVDIPHGYVGFLEIFQWLTADEAAVLHEDRNRSGNQRQAFHFKHLKIFISGGANAERVTPKPLRFHKVPSVTMT